MKLSGRDAVRFFEHPKGGHAGILIFGPDPMRVAHRRQQLIKAIVGEAGEEEMRLTRLSGADLRKEANLLGDAMRAQGFFPGPRVVFVEGATDGLTKTLKAALDDWQKDDAFIVATGGQLTARASLRKLFESHAAALSAAIYVDPPTQGEIDSTLKKAGLSAIAPAALQDLGELARALDPGDFSQTVEKLGLYKHGDSSEVTSADVAACAPSTIEAALDDALNIIAEAKAGQVAPIMHRLEGQGMNATSICIGAARHFRTLHTAASHPNGVEAGLSACRPPVFGPRRDRMARQSRTLGVRKLETALTILTDTDLSLRSSSPVPARAMLERAFIRIAMLART